ncbi:hypothetical protein ABK040_011309 [Willaertia magna]
MSLTTIAEQHVAKGNAAFEKYFNDGTPELIANCYFPDSILTHLATKSNYKGDEAIGQFFKNVLHDGMMVRNLKLTSLEVKQLDEMTIYELGEVNGKLPEDKLFNGTYTIIWKLDEKDGVYKIKFDTF